MRKIFTLIAAIIICSMQTVLATDVSGTISTNTTWDAAGSPYIVTSSITVNDGVTLTVQSGVTVKFDNSQYMYVYGTLNATSAIFTSNGATPTSGDWGSIQVGGWNISESGVLNLNSCQILYSSQLFVCNGDATLTNTDLTNFSSYGIKVEDYGNLNMTGGNINTNNPNTISSGVGIYANANSQSALSGVNIQHFENGILMLNNADVEISNVNIFNCTWPITYYASADLTVDAANSMSGNINDVVRLSFYNVTDTMSLPLIDVPYFFPNGMQINENCRMVVVSNNILKFADNTRLEVFGSLAANAAVGESIFFTSYRDDNWGGDSNGDGTVSAPGVANWYGVLFQNESIDASSVMRRCQIRYAGAGYTGGISLANASPTIDNCDLSNNYFGVYMQYASNPVFSNNTIGSSAMTPIAMSFEANPVMSNNTLSFSDNEYDAIGIIGGTMSANATLKIRSVTSVPNITYLLLGQITVPVGKTLTINKGIVIKSYSSDWDYHRIVVEGTLNANATADSMITFTSARDDNYGNPSDCNKDGTITSPEIADWGGIVFNPGGTGTLNYCRIKYAKVWNYSFSTCSTTEYVNETAVAMIDASPTISNCEFKDLKYAISCYRASNPALSNNSMVNIEFTPINISGSSNPTISGITFTNVGWRAIGLLGGNVCLNGTIKKRDMAGFTNITYVLLSDMTINSGTNVNVEPGVVIKVNGNSWGYGNIFVDGGFKTDGTSGSRVVFSSIKDDNEGNPLDSNGDGNATTPETGNWASIKYRSTSNDAYCLLNYTTIKYAGSSNEGGATFENAGGQLKNSIVSNTSNYGVYCNGNANPVIDNVTIQNCSLDPIAMSLTSNPTFTNITFVSNFSQAIKIIEGTLSSNATLAPRNVAGITNIAYVVDKLLISSNAKLTILPDVVIKFRGDSYPYNTYIKVNGNLIANGNAAHKIYLTSFADDSKGGDSNNNGNASAPDKNDWGQGWNYYGWNPYPGGIIIENNSNSSDTVNSFKYCELSYAGTGMRFENSHATIDNCVVQLTKYYGASVVGSSNPNFTNNQFYNINFSPIELSMFSNPTFTNNTALNVGYMALSVIPETYSQTATVPIRNFGGYNNITYFLEAPCTINSGTTITIPAGVVFKSSSSGNSYYYSGQTANGFVVNGKIIIQGTSGNPVVFTNDKDDNYGNPLDMNQDGNATVPPNDITNNWSWSGNWLTFNDVSDDLSSIDNVIMKYADKGVATLSASPIINHTRFENMYYGVDMNGVSAPKIDNSTFHNLQYFPMQISLVSYPASTLNNVLSGLTYKVIKVKDETLTQDVTLPKRNFGDVTNIPYYIEKYVIGTGATLTIAPGVVCKFKTKSYWETGVGISIFKGLKAEGGSSADSSIVFTNIKDDFYGGDSNSDTLRTSPTIGDWDGLIFQDESLDPLCSLKNCIIRFANKGISTMNASPTVAKSNINNNNYGVYAAGSSNPVFSNCDFIDNFYFAIDNVDKSFDINAKNCWWSSNLGPIQNNNPGDGTSEQEIVTDNVDFTPWVTSGTVSPLMGDVSLNGVVQAYDASLILKHTVGSLTLTAQQQKVADVTGAAGISALDASMILQYNVGLIQSFPAESKKRSAAIQLSEAQLTVGSSDVLCGEEFPVSLSVKNAEGMSAAEIRLVYNPAYLKFTNIENVQADMNMVFNNDAKKGVLSISYAGVYALHTDAFLANVHFIAVNELGNSISTQLTVDRFLANETDATANSIKGNININVELTCIPNLNDPNVTGMLQISPNPTHGDAVLTYQLADDYELVTIELFTLGGQLVSTLVNHSKDKGMYTVSLSGKGVDLENGVYMLKMKVDGVTQTQKFQVVK